MGRELVAARGLTIRTRAPRGGGNRRLHGFCTTCHIRTRRPPLPHTPGCAERNPRMCDIGSRNCRFAALRAREKQGGQPLRKQDGLGRGAHGNRPRAPPSDRSTLRQHGSPRHSQGTCPLRSQWVTEASFERPTTNKKGPEGPRRENAPCWSATSCSPTDYSAVPSALGGLTSGFGMGPGVPPLPWPLAVWGRSASGVPPSTVPWGPHSARKRRVPRDRPWEGHAEELGRLVPLG